MAEYGPIGEASILKCDHFAPGDRVMVTLVYEGVVAEHADGRTLVVLDASGNQLRIMDGAKDQIVQKVVPFKKEIK